MKSLTRSLLAIVTISTLVLVQSASCSSIHSQPTSLHPVGQAVLSRFGDSACDAQRPIGVQHMSTGCLRATDDNEEGKGSLKMDCAAGVLRKYSDINCKDEIGEGEPFTIGECLQFGGDSTWMKVESCHVSAPLSPPPQGGGLCVERHRDQDCQGDVVSYSCTGPSDGSCFEASGLHGAKINCATQQLEVYSIARCDASGSYISAKSTFPALGTCNGYTRYTSCGEPH